MENDIVQRYYCSMNQLAPNWHREMAGGEIHVVNMRRDLVILSANPLTVEPVKIRDIQVLETIKEGKSVYK